MLHPVCVSECQRLSVGDTGEDGKVGLTYENEGTRRQISLSRIYIFLLQFSLFPSVNTLQGLSFETEDFFRVPKVVTKMCMSSFKVQ
jgi:hypothetical protein